MTLTDIAHDYLTRFKQRHGRTTRAAQWSALNAILGCRTAQYGELLLSCQGCAQPGSQYRACGHRSCNQCQNHSTTQWLERQQAKLLPVQYFMVTFTLPCELRALAKANQAVVYGLLLQCARSVLKTFGQNQQGLEAELGMTAVLHTHSRRLDYHPHVHVIVPGGGINTGRNEWRKLKGCYLFNGYALAQAFRGRLLAALDQAGLPIPVTPKKWVVQCERVGQGLPALKYLSRYLYRGVISNQQLLSDDGTNVTFQYRDSKTNQLKTCTELGEDFLARVLQHVLPKGFRRARDYGFLHGNAKPLLKRVQWLLRVAIPAVEDKPRPAFLCKICQAPMSVIGFKPPQPTTG